MTQATTETVIFAPQPGPQEAFMASTADIAILGGSAGGGKTFAVLLWLAALSSIKDFCAVVFRRVAPDLTGGGSIWEESQEIFRAMGGQPRQSPNLDWRFPSGALVEFRHLQHASDVYSHQGKQYATVVFEELPQFEESQFWYLVSRLRTKSRVRAHLRATCNPDPDSFVRALIDWWIDPDGFPIRERSGLLRWFVRDPRGELHWFDTREAAVADFPKSKPLSLTFIPATLSDNPKGDPTYRERLEALPLVERARLLGGNWNIRKTAGTVLRREWFQIVDSPPGQVLRSVRGWDKGATVGGDWTRGAKWCALSHGYYLADMASVRGTPGEVFAKMRACAEQDGLTTRVAIWQDPGQAGIVDVDTTREQIKGYALDVHKAASSKVSYAEQWGVIAEKGSKGEGPPVYIQRAAWNEAFLAEVDAFPGGKHDDQVDAVSCAHQSIKVTSGGVYVPPKGHTPPARPWSGLG
jgi:phage terminase large subunit-like protein